MLTTTQLFFRHILRSKIRFFFLILASLFSLFQASSVEAGGWGKTEKVFDYEGATWNEVYFDMNQLYFSASIPNYSGAVMQNGTVSVNGAVDDFGYSIITSFNQEFTPPKSLEEFVRIVQEANPTYTIVLLKSKKFGTKYGVDLIPNNQEEKDFWRFLSTKNRLIKMGTIDPNHDRRQKFFESILIKK